MLLTEIDANGQYLAYCPSVFFFAERYIYYLLTIN